MTKRHLSKQQQRRIDDAHKNQLDEAQLARVVKRFGKQAMVELSSGECIRAQIRQNLASVVVGDRVAIQQEGEAVITALSPRQNELTRLSRFGQLKPLAANITQIILVLAVEPESTFLLIDSYLVAASILGVKAALVLNKSDLCLDKSEIEHRLQVYTQLGYPIVWTSKNETLSYDAMSELLSNEVSVFVGQSGVGKSTIIKKLLPHEDIDVSSISEKQKLGRHTTTSAALYHLDKCSDIIDSPGVREFFLQNYTEDDLFQAFSELTQLKRQCKFRNCRHFNEKGCALNQERLLQEGVSLSRLESFKTLLKRLNDD